MLAAVGLSAEQQDVYLALLDVGPATTAEVRDRVAGARVAPALAALEAKGLISRLPGRPVRYQPARPDMAMEVLVRSQEQDSLLRLIRKLPPDRQTLLILKFVENMSNAEIGQIMGRSEGAIKSLYHRTLLALRDELGDQNISLEGD